MEHNASIFRHSRRMFALLAATVLLTATAPSADLVIQGRITGIHGALVTVKTPNGYPGPTGGHAQFVTAGPTLSVNISRARVLLPDGKQPDKIPLAIDDRVLMLLNEPESGSPVAPGNVNRIYFASVIERIAESDKMITH